MPKVKQNKDQETKEWKCPQCGKGFATKRKVDAHIRRVHPDKKFECEHEGCGKVFKSIYDLHGHVKFVHGVLKKCPECHKKVKRLDNHMQKKHKIKLANGDTDKIIKKCPQCHKGFRLDWKLQNHVKFVHGDLKKCPECFKEVKRLDDHMLKVHKEKLLNCDAEELLKECPLCHKKLKHLELHKQRRHSEKEHKCEICSQTYDKKEELLNHMSIAHVEKKRPFKCTVCLKAFTQKIDRDRHVSGIHMHIRAFKCDVCGKAFKLNGHLKVHMNWVHSKQEKEENNN